MRSTASMRAASFLRRNAWVITGTAAALVALAVLELHGGRLPWGPDGRFGWWDGNIHGSENSQRVADAYSFTHVLHGILIYAGLWLFARRVPARYRFLAAVLIEAGWELLENSPFVIERYRAGTVSQGYVGDSVLNSVSDVLMMALGFLVAHASPARLTVALAIAMEVGLLLWVGDNLTINVVMLVHPIPAIREWQAAHF